jgi:hypothetical protein
VIFKLVNFKFNFKLDHATQAPSQASPISGLLQNRDLKLNSTFSKFINRQGSGRVTILVTTLASENRASGLKTKFKVNKLQTVTILPFKFTFEVY